ncbi:hypothetical protein E1B25_16430 [Antarcticimicrobium sediminis]|uniref:Uncharacterized protein n=1 Tax=Antarcticimicrobium sediminis TaxID=2546227 RepID=A0A4R5ELK9_9RHOB|nr:hypothetical protein E1B25_16430 [Antarcticimicrobium sediminis]
MAGFYSARSRTIPPLPWPNFAPPFSAVAITLFCAFPFRVADTAMRFGEEILWDGTGYRFDLVLSKNRMPFAAPIQPVFGLFLSTS